MNKSQLIAEIRNGRKDLRGVDLSGVDLRGVDLSGVDLRATNLYGVDLCGANLSKAILYIADLRRANLRGADLRGANLRDANLRGTNLYGANLYGADLYWADLCLTNLSGANLTNTTLPNGQMYEEYLKTLPELFTATGRKFEEIVTKKRWDCHSWGNCPMAAVFSVNNLKQIPDKWRKRAYEFITLFDGGALPFETVIKLQCINHN